MPGVRPERASDRAARINMPSTSIREAVFHAIDELNQQLPPNRHLARRETTPLAGPDGPLDSLGVVNLIVLVEQQLEARAGITINLIDTELLEGGAALNTVGTLVAFITSALDERAHV
jgi:acyl carrier protein